MVHRFCPHAGLLVLLLTARHASSLSASTRAPRRPLPDQHCHGLDNRDGEGPASLSRRQALLNSHHSAVASVATGTGAFLWPPPAASAATTSPPPLPRLEQDKAILSDGSIFPLASFGLQIYDDATAYRLTTMALEVGYRNFFASVLAGNQVGFAQAVQDSGIPRSDLYICGSVVSNRVAGYDAAKALTQRGIRANFRAFAAGNIDYLDQIMLDYPGPDVASIRGQWAAFQDLHDQQLTKSLSVSNFSPAQLDCILSDPQTRVAPVVNQLPYSVAYHPSASSDIIAENAKRGVLVQAWAPLGKSLGGRFTSAMKGACAEIGQPYNKSWAQVALRWIVQRGAAFTTQSQKRNHFVENLDIFDFQLTEAEMSKLDRLA